MLNMVHGVHLEDTGSPSLSGQWSHRDLDVFVRQLANPKHHISHVAVAPPRHCEQGETTEHTYGLADLTGALRQKCSVHVTNTVSRTEQQQQQQQARQPVTSRKAMEEHPAPKPASRWRFRKTSSEANMASGSGRQLKSSTSSTSSSSSASSSGSARKTSQASEERRPSSELDEAVEVSFGSVCEDDIFDVTASSSHNASVPATASGRLADLPPARARVPPHHSSPEASDSEPRAEGEGARGGSSQGARREGGKDSSRKRRFKKMLPRPLRRSQSAGCAKDIPAHALFLQHQPHSSKVESMEMRRAKLSLGNEEEVEGACSSRPRPIHKTASADAAMMAHDLGALSSSAAASTAAAPKPKSRSIAKNVRRKLQALRRRHTDSNLGLEGGAQGNSEAQKWSQSFETLLTDKHGVELFRAFLRSEFSEENLEFWLACQAFKAAKPAKMPALARQIYGDYVALHSAKEVNLDSHTRSRAMSEVTNPSRQTFDEAQRRVQALMEKDSYPRFLQSPAYLRLLASPSK